MHDVDAELRRHGSSAAPVVAGDQRGLDAQRMQSGHGRRGAALERVAESQKRQQLRLVGHIGQPGHGAAFGFQCQGAAGKGADIDFELLHEARAAQPQFAPLEHRRHAAPGHGPHLRRSGHIKLLLQCELRDDQGQRMLAARLDGGGPCQRRIA